MSDSADVKQTLSKLRRDGYSLHLMINCKRGDEDPDQLELSSHGKAATQPDFRIDGRDLSFLRSIGIDPTRYLRKHTD